jgi:phosphoribosylamine--glycine ligase
MRVLIVGSGGREHALAWKLSRSPRVAALFATPGSDGIARVATCLPGVSVLDADALIRVAREQRVDLVVIGPEDPLALGVADRLREAGFAVFGPSAAAARLEASKGFARAFMARHGIPHPRFEACAELASAERAVRARGGKCVVKADGLAAGKGVAVCASEAEALAALGEMMGARRFGDSGARVVIEDVLAGEEASYLVVTDGERVVPFAPAQDHKRALDGDRGENTGGMGAYAPAPLVTDAVEKRVLEEIVHPTLRGLRAEGTPFSGVLYVGLMIDPSGAPAVVEFNCRFGDPETQVLVMQMDGDLLPLLDGAARGRLDESLRARGEGAAVCVVLASRGYPREFVKGQPIRGLEAAEAVPGVAVFHAGTRRMGSEFVTNGGRVLGVTARGASFAEARERAYAAADRIAFDGLHLRRDIGARALAR